MPFVLAVVELAEGPVMFSNLVGCEPGEVQIGMALQVRFDRVAAGVWLPRFEPVRGARPDAQRQRA